MKNEEVRKWQNEQALKRYEMIAPLLDPDIDNAKRCQLREEIAKRIGTAVLEKLFAAEEKEYTADGEKATEVSAP